MGFCGLVRCFKRIGGANPVGGISSKEEKRLETGVSILYMSACGASESSMVVVVVVI